MPKMTTNKRNCVLKSSPKGNQTPVSCVTDEDTYHYTTEATKHEIYANKVIVHSHSQLLSFEFLKQCSTVVRAVTWKSG